MLTANRLIDGTVLYWRGTDWVEAMADGDVFENEAEAKAAVEAAKVFVATNKVVNPYLLEMKGERPLKEREIIRALGPSVRRDLGKQADDQPAGFSLPEPAAAMPKESDTDVSI